MHTRIFLFNGIIFLLAALVLAGCAASTNPQRAVVKKLVKGKIPDDTSYVYTLPYESGKSYRMIQGYFSRLSHKERAAIDFKMKRGSKISAARSGVVTRVKEDGEKGGLNRKYRSEGNFIIIEHEDGSRAGYWHLQKDGALVNVGDTVQQGQVIALSGKTGYAAMPHLHFLVWGPRNGQWVSIATRFETKKGPRYLRWWRKYKKP